MRDRGAVRGWKALSRIALIGLVGGGAAACSSDASRLGEPFSNPFSSLSGEPAATGSLGEDPDAVPASAPAIRTPRIQSQALAAPGATMSPRAVPSAPPVSGAVSGLNPSGMNPDAGRAKPMAPAMTPRAAPAAAPQTKLKFTQGPKPAEKAPEKKVEAPAKKAETKAETKASAKVVETKPAKAPEPKHQAKAEPKLDPKKAEAAKEAAKKVEVEAKAAKSEAAKKVAEAKAAEAAAKASAKETKQAVKETPAPAPVKVASAEPTAPVAQDSSDSFRWPAKGRVINGYGSSGNEGINIAVPEGTPVKAAEEGTVAYAGSDVKGYGKLVLVRHNNGYVSAYAHNGEIDVRPGEKVKRGQVIAKSGATGNVTSPQLHFEIRKGATPVDPIPHLASN